MLLLKIDQTLVNGKYGSTRIETRLKYFKWQKELLMETFTESLKG